LQAQAHHAQDARGHRLPGVLLIITLFKPIVSNSNYRFIQQKIDQI
jgi:hypothetical protein